MDTKGSNGVDVELRVSNSTSATSLATAILRYIEEGKRVTLSCIGPQSISQALKSVAISNGELAPQGKVNWLLPMFHNKEITDRTTNEQMEVTSMRCLLSQHTIG